ncbi:MAG: hypothetical protein KDC98_15260 [Planctomycetes bacterium]|nr:hypothetical protein [Planctomycetota bacterium]
MTLLATVLATSLLHSCVLDLRFGKSRPQGEPATPVTQGEAEGDTTATPEPGAATWRAGWLLGGRDQSTTVAGIDGPVTTRLKEKVLGLEVARTSGHFEFGARSTWERFRETATTAAGGNGVYGHLHTIGPTARYYLLTKDHFRPWIEGGLALGRVSRDGPSAYALVGSYGIGFSYVSEPGWQLDLGVSRTDLLDGADRDYAFEGDSRFYLGMSTRF